MPSPLARLRARAFHRQSGYCFYCRYPMWEGSAELFAATYHLTLRQARRLQCTAEHLHARSDGGRDAEGNIVAACRACNAYRHRRKVARDATHHRRHVEWSVGQGRWHPAWLVKKLSATRVPFAGVRRRPTDAADLAVSK